MTISVRLSDKSETELRLRSRRMGRPLSDFVREAIEEKLQREGRNDSPYSLGKELFGRRGSGDTNRSSDRKRLIRDKIRKKLDEKHHHR